MTTMTIAPNAAVPILAVQAATPGELAVMMVLIVAAVTVALAAVVLVVSAYRLRGTTLFAPVLWVLFSLVMMIIIHSIMLRAHTYRSTREKFDLLATTSTFCPLISL